MGTSSTKLMVIPHHETFTALAPPYSLHTVLLKVELPPLLDEVRRELADLALRVAHDVALPPLSL
jgi:hypothetical protein